MDEILVQPSDLYSLGPGDGKFRPNTDLFRVWRCKMLTKSSFR